MNLNNIVFIYRPSYLKYKIDKNIKIEIKSCFLQPKSGHES